MNRLAHQPSYWAVENIGDASPVEYGGKFVCIDRTGNYAPMLWILDVDDVEDESLDPPELYTRFRISHVELERCFLIKQSANVILGVGANVYHGYMTEWFGSKNNLASVASTCGTEVDDLCNSLCSSNVIERAFAYDMLVSHYGVHEFDQYPREVDEAEAERVCDKFIQQIEESKSWHEGFGFDS